MNYYWTECPGCHCQVAINSSVSPNRVSGSLRRWSSDRSTNDGRSFEVRAANLAPGGSFAVACVCGREILVPSAPSAVGGEREPGLRVKLESR